MRLTGFLIIPFLFLLTLQSTAQPTYQKFKRKSDNRKVKCKTVRKDVVTTNAKASIDISLRDIKLINGSAGIDKSITRIREEIPNLQVLEALTYAVCETYGNDALTPEQYGTYMIEIVPKVKAFVSGSTKSKSGGKKGITKKDLPKIIGEYHKVINSKKYIKLPEIFSFPMATFHEFRNFSRYEVENILRENHEKRTIETNVDLNSIEIRSRSGQGYNVSYRFTQFDRYKDGSRKTWRVKEDLMIDSAGKIYYIYQPETILQK